MQWTTSMRKPSTPRSSQKRSTPCMASTTSGFDQLRSGCCGRNRWRYHCPVASSSVQAGPPKAARQLFGGAPSRSSRQWYQSRFGDDRDERDSRNQGWWSDVWFGTQSTSTRMLALVRSGDQAVGVRQGAEQRVDVAVVADVVAEVRHRRPVERRDPDGIDAEPGQVVEPPLDAGAGRRRRRRRCRGTTAGRPGRRRRRATRERVRRPPSRRSGSRSGRCGEHLHRFASAASGEGAGVLSDLWYKNAVFYSLNVETFMDGDGDGCGDFEGLARRLDYLESLGVDALWLAPFQPSPLRDDGYDISRLLQRRHPARLVGRLRRVHAPGGQPRHPRDHRPGREPHLGPASLVPRCAREPRRAHARLVRVGAEAAAELAIGDRVSRRAARHLDARPEGAASGTTTASTTTSPT